jgi:hypothetical protein
MLSVHLALEHENCDRVVERVDDPVFRDASAGIVRPLDLRITLRVVLRPVIRAIARWE